LQSVIDPRPYQDVLDQAKANLQNADAQRQLKEANFARAQRLFQNNVTAKEDYDTSVSQRNQAEAEFAQARASVNSAALNVEFTEVKSPIQGRISRQLVTRGNLVQADSTVLTKVVSVDPIYAYFNVDQRTIQKYHNQIQGGQLQDPRVSAMPVYLQLEGETGFPHEGVIDFVDNTYNASTGTLPIRGRFKNDDASLYPDAFVRTRIAGTPKHDAILITDRAVGTSHSTISFWTGLATVTGGGGTDGGWLCPWGLHPPAASVAKRARDKWGSQRHYGRDDDHIRHKRCPQRSP
jgi:RND family efflux transporter MFP subunit